MRCEDGETDLSNFILGFFTINEMFLSQLYNLSLLWPLILII